MGNPVIISEGLGRAAQLIMADANYIAVGTGGDEPSVSDSQLASETNRVAVAQTFRQGAIFQVRALFNNANLPTTVKEIGLFLNGSGSPNTGDMLVRVLETFAKGASDWLIVVEITLS